MCGVRMADSGCIAPTSPQPRSSARMSTTLGVAVPPSCAPATPASPPATNIRTASILHSPQRMPRRRRNGRFMKWPIAQGYRNLTGHATAAATNGAHSALE